MAVSQSYNTGILNGPGLTKWYDTILICNKNLHVFQQKGINIPAVIHLIIYLKYQFVHKK